MGQVLLACCKLTMASRIALSCPFLAQFLSETRNLHRHASYPARFTIHRESEKKSNKYTLREMLLWADTFSFIGNVRNTCYLFHSQSNCDTPTVAGGRVIAIDVR